MNIKLHIKHFCKSFFLPSDGINGIYRNFRNLDRQCRLEKIRKTKALIASIYDLSDMD